MISFLGGAIGADIHNDRAGIHCRSITDSAKVLDALKDPVNGYYDPRDVFTTVPRSSVLDGSVRRSGRDSRRRGIAQGRAHRHHPRVDAHVPGRQGRRADRPGRRAEIKDVLGAHLGATLVESTDPLWPDDPADREHDDELHARARGARAGLLPRPAVSG